MLEQVKTISIIIPCRNGGKTLRKVLKQVFSQDLDSGAKLEVTAVDSSSTDDTPEILSSFPNIRVIKIDPKDFGHGRTRNLGAKHAKGEYLLFLNQDALPANNQWLNELLRSFDNDPMIAAVFSRHVPDKGCNLYLARDLEAPMAFSTVSCAMRREIWEKHPFDDAISIAEDKEWANRVAMLGYKVIFAPQSMVIHSHNYRVSELFRIKYLVGKEFIRTERNGRRRPFMSVLLCIGGITLKTIADIAYILKQDIPVHLKVREISISFIARISSFTGRLLGELVG